MSDDCFCSDENSYPYRVTGDDIRNRTAEETEAAIGSRHGLSSDAVFSAELLRGGLPLRGYRQYTEGDILCLPGTPPPGYQSPCGELWGPVQTPNGIVNAPALSSDEIIQSYDERTYTFVIYNFITSETRTVAVYTEPETQPVVPPEGGQPIAAYTIRTEEDILRIAWESLYGGSSENFSAENAEDRIRETFADVFIAFLDLVVAGSYYDTFFRIPNIGSFSLAERFVLDPQTVGSVRNKIMTELSIEEIVHLYNHLRNLDFIASTAAYYPEASSIADAYLYVYAWELNITLPFDPYANFNPHLAAEDWLLQEVQGSEDDIAYAKEHVRSTLISHIVNVMMAVQKGFGYFPDDMDFTDAAALFGALDASFEFHDLIAIAERIAEKTREICPEEGTPCVSDGTSQFGLDTDLSEIERLTGGYHDALAYDQMRQLIYDPTWHPDHTERQLTELGAAIMAMPTHIVGVDVRFARASMQHYLNTMRHFHEWRKRVKPGFDRIEHKMLARREDNANWWSALLWAGLIVAEIGLSVLFEPADWIFTARDLMTGDWLALVGLLPLVPSTLDNLGQLMGRLREIENLEEFRQFMAGHGMEAASEAIWNTFNLEEFEAVTEAARRMDYAEFGIGESELAGLMEQNSWIAKLSRQPPADIVPFEDSGISTSQALIYPPEWQNLPDKLAQRVFRNSRLTYQEWLKTQDAANAQTVADYWRANFDPDLPITGPHPELESPITYYGLAELARQFNRETSQNWFVTGDINVALGYPPTLFDKVTFIIGGGSGTGVPSRSGIMQPDFTIRTGIPQVVGGNVHVHPPVGFLEVLSEDLIFKFQAPSSGDWNSYLQKVNLRLIESGTHATIIPRRQRFVIHYWIDANGQMKFTKQSLPYQLP
jgi:hypothetical protein